MRENQLSRYGAIAKALPYLGPQGKAFFVAGTANDYYGDFQHFFPADSDGVERVHSTISSAVTAATAGRGDVIFIAPGSYDETVTVSKADLTFVGLGGRGAAFIATTTAGAEGMNVTANDVTLINLGIEAENTADYALNVFGARFRAERCKFEGPTADVVRVGPDTVANGAASGVRTGADALFDDCEFAWGGTGLEIVSSDYGACTELYLRNCRFHDNTVAHIGENDAGVVGAGKGIVIKECLFQVGSDGVAPTDWIDFNSAGSTGIICGNYFEDNTFDSATIQLAAGVLFVGNWAEAESGGGAASGTAGRPD